MRSRRSVLTLSAGALAGCTGLGNTRQFRVSFVEIINWTETERRVTLRIQKNGDQRFEETEEIPAKDESGVHSWRLAEEWMDEQAAYTVEIDGTWFNKTTASTQSVVDSYDLDSETSCLSWTLQIRADGSVGVFPSPGCPRETDR